MRLTERIILQRLRAILLGLVVAGFASGAALAQGDGDRVFTERPTVAASEVKGAAAADVKLPTARQAMLQRGPAPSWIWGASPEKTWVLRKEFPGGAIAATLWATADNAVTLFLNGKEIGSSDEWTEPILVDLAGRIVEGRNELTAVVKNEGAAAGFACKIVLTGENGRDRYVVSDRSWRASPSIEAKSGVAVKVVGRMGDAPWGDLLAKSAGNASVKRGVFQTLPGYKVEHLFTVPRDRLGSWVSMTRSTPRGGSDRQRPG